MIHQRFALALLPMVLFGCMTVTITAKNSINPVLLGPVRAMGPAAPAAQPMGAFETESSHGEWATSAGGPQLAGDTWKAADAQTDFDVFLATEGDRQRYIIVEDMRCGSHAFFFVFFFAEDNTWCDTRGKVYRLPPPEKAWGPNSSPARIRGVGIMEGSRPESVPR